MSDSSSLSNSNKPKREINIQRRLINDSISGAGAALIVTPIMKIVDFSVTAGASGKQTMYSAAWDLTKQLFTAPQKFVFNKFFAWIFTVYGSTYIANNTIDSLCKIYHVNDIIPKLTGVTAVNMFTSILKDAAFARLLGTKPPGKIPLNSYIIWFIRDVLAIGAAFIVPERLSRWMQANKGYEKNSADKIAQFASPVGLQTFFTPIHLLGFDFYNNTESTGKERAIRVAKKYPQALPLRYVRMAGAYGIGGVNNKSFRNILHGKAEGKDWDSNY